MSDLTAKAANINGLINEANSHAYSALEKAAEAGAALLDVKEELPHGDFTLWVDKNIPVGIRQCQKYMKIATQGLPDANSEFALEMPKTINAASGNPPKKKSKTRVVQPEKPDPDYLEATVVSGEESGPQVVESIRVPRPAPPADDFMEPAPSVDFADLPDEPETDALEEALEEEGLPPIDKQDTRLPNLSQMMVMQLDGKLEGLNPAQKRVVRKYIKDEVRRQVEAKIGPELTEQRVALANLQGKYNRLIKLRKEDIKMVKANLHPDRPERTPEQLTKAMQSFNRMIEVPS